MSIRAAARVLRDGVNRLAYIAGPCETGDIDVNRERAIDAGRWALARGLVPVIPHTMLRGLEDIGRAAIMGACLALVARCGCVVRFTGPSPGADEETDLAKVLGLPIHYLDPSDA